jgi:hypothetical protein
MNSLKIFFLFIVIIIPLQLKSQVHEEWDVRYRGASDTTISSKSVKYDSYGNVYVLGDAGFNSSQLLTLKYNNRGELQWATRRSNTYAVTMELDNLGNVYVCGQISSNGGGIIIKYSSFGATQWEVLRNYTIEDMVIDDFGNIYISGYGSNGYNTGILTAKYNPAGNLLWDQILSSSNSGGCGYRIILDNAGNVYTLTDYDYTGISSIKVLKYNNNGVLQWIGTASQAFDLSYYGFAGLGIDDNGNIYCGGTIWSQTFKSDYIITKFSTTGQELWYRTYNSEYNLNDIPVDMKVSENGNTCITGYSYTDSTYHTKVATLMYDSTGLLKWKRDYNNSNGFVFPGGLAADILKNIYITINNPNYTRITTIKYDSSGNQKWLIDYIGISNQTVVKDIAADNYGNIYLCGFTSGIQHPECLTIRYLQSWNSNLMITGCVKFKDNALPVEGGYIKAVKLDRNNGNIITIDSTPIQVTGYYSLKHIPSDSVYLIAYPPENQSFIPSYYPQSIYWKNAQKIFASSNLSDVNLNVERQLASSGNCTVKGRISKIVNKNLEFIKDALIYLKNGNNFLRNVTSDQNGLYEINSVQQGSIKIIVDRLGYSADSLSMNLVSGNTYDNINFYLNQIYVNVSHLGNKIPTVFSLSQNYPNPFNPVTKIKFDILSGFPLRAYGNDKVVLKVYDIMGREIQILVNEKLNPGTYEVTFDGSNFASGIYFYQLRSGDFVETKKLVLLK